MEELWRKVSELIMQRPLLWLPVLVADLLAFLAGLGGKAWLQDVLVSRLGTRSVMGGPTVMAPVSPSAIQSAVQAVAPIEWGVSLLRLLLYTLAFLATAALVRAFRARSQKPGDEIGTVMRRQFTDILPVAGTALLVYLVVAFVARFLSTYLIRHGHRAALQSGAYIGGWFGLAVGAVTIVALALLVAPAAVQALARRALDATHRQQAQILALSLGMVAMVLGRFVEANLMEMRGASPVARALLGISGSWIAALPYAVLFAGLGFLAIKAGWGMETQVSVEE